MNYVIMGQTYGQLTIVKFDGYRGKNPYWKCRCSCGREKSIREYSFTNGTTKSCGCVVHKKSQERMKLAREYNAWISMKKRCFNEHCHAYKNYGGRGITVCEQWKNNFNQFLLDMGECPDGLSIDRIDNNGNYEPSNCRWASKREQAQNRRSNRYITYNNVTKLISDLADQYGILRSTMSQALNRYGCSIDDIIKRNVRVSV